MIDVGVEVRTASMKSMLMAGFAGMRSQEGFMLVCVRVQN